MTDLGTQIRTYIDEIDPPFDPQDLMREHRAAVSSMRANPFFGRPVFVFSITAIVVLVLIGGFALVLQDPSDPVVGDPVVVTTVPPVVTTVPQSEADVVPTVPSSLPSLATWQQVGSEVMVPIAGISDITRMGDRLVAAGRDPGEDLNQDGVVLVSEDGFAWTRIAEGDPSLTAGMVIMNAITEGGPGLVAVGIGCDDDPEGVDWTCRSQARVWTSVDGTIWTHTPHDTEVFGPNSHMEDVAATDLGIVAVGRLISKKVDEEALTTRPAVWTSEDGVDWARAWLGESFDLAIPTEGSWVESTMQAITVGPGGRLVAVGTVVDDFGVDVAAVWTSDDGTTWERVPHDSEVFASPIGLDMIMYDVAAGQSGLVAVGREGDFPPSLGSVSSAAVWTSLDGITWKRVNLDNETLGTVESISTIAASTTGFVAAGPSLSAWNADASPITIWTSPDGISWQAVASLGVGTASSVVGTGPVVAVAGSVLEGTAPSGIHAAVWVQPEEN